MDAPWFTIDNIYSPMARSCLKHTYKSLLHGQAKHEGVSRKNCSDDVLAHIFMHPALKSGQLIHYLCLNSSVSQLEEFTSRHPSLAEIFFNTASMMASDPSKLLGLRPDNEITLGAFPCDSETEPAYCYSIKLALLFKPMDTDLHEFILTRMDMTRMQAFKLELMCLLAKGSSSRSAHFSRLFEESAWLMGLSQKPLGEMRWLPNDEVVESGEVNAPLLKIDFRRSHLSYGVGNNRAYRNMIAILGSQLIKKHENELFARFLFSIRPHSNHFDYKCFVDVALNYFNFDCLVPLFALCNNKIGLLSLTQGNVSLSSADASSKIKLKLEQI